MNDERHLADSGSLEPPLDAAVKAVLAEPVAEDAIERVKTRARRIADGAEAESVRPAPRRRSANTWGWIARHRASSVTATTILALAVAGVVLWLHSGGATPAFADFLQPILDAKTVKYKMTLEMTGAPKGSADTAGLSPERVKEMMKPQAFEVMDMGGSRIRRESEIPGKSKRVEIWDGRQRKQLVLVPAMKQATLYDCSQGSDDKTTGNERQSSGEPGPVSLFRALLLDTVRKPDGQRESLGEKEIDGRRVVGFRLSHGGAVLSVWGDPETRLPVRLEATMAAMPYCKVTASNFEFNVPMDESLFSVDPPAGYTVVNKQSQPRDESPTGEKDLIEMFRYYARWMGGRFPDVLDVLWMDEVVSGARRLDADLTPGRPQEERNRERQEAGDKFRRGMEFVMLMPKESDWHYAGRSVSLGAADTPVFWYRPKDAEKFRVIHGDLSVQETETPPQTPIVPATQPEEDLIAMVRRYAELNGGLFPNDLVFPKFGFECFRYPLTLSAAQKQEFSEARPTLLQGVVFVDLLPTEADWTYAGKGVWLGAADRPIFWYRPGKNDAYRVVYADLSVRDAKTAPGMSVVPPEQDLLNALRYYSQLFDGRFPISLDDPALLGPGCESFLYIALSKVYVKFPADVEYYPTATQTQESIKATRNIQPGVDFVASLPPQSDRHYAGWGVVFGTADRPIFWYQPQGSGNYRVIYADLSVRDADAAPDVTAAPPLDDLIDALRCYSEQSNGPFPDSLDRKGVFQVLAKELAPYVGQRPTAKQSDACGEGELKLQPGVAFAVSLAPEADAHYAGKGVSFGQAETPIFWYRPKAADAYQVIYADLSVRETGTPPEGGGAQAVPDHQ